MKLAVVILAASALVGFRGAADEGDYYQRFLAALPSAESDFISGSALVDTNNAGPVITNQPLFFRRFHDLGELAGGKLGMTMSEVVAVWGKPRLLYSHCYIGPRFWYVRNHGFGDLSLSFKRDRLVLIGITGRTLQMMRFDNGLNGQMQQMDCERLLGPPTVRTPDPQGTLFVGEIGYRTNNLRTDLLFDHPGEGRESADGGLSFVSVRLEREAGGKSTGEPVGPANGSQPSRPGTNSNPSAAGSRR
jgi:hypothetical protein